MGPFVKRSIKAHIVRELLFDTKEKKHYNIIKGKGLEYKLWNLAIVGMLAFL